MKTRGNDYRGEVAMWVVCVLLIQCMVVLTLYIFVYKWMCIRYGYICTLIHVITLIHVYPGPSEDDHTHACEAYVEVIIYILIKKREGNGRGVEARVAGATR